MNQYDITCADFNPIFLFSWQGPRLFSDEEHTHEYIELSLVLEGNAYWKVDGKEYKLTRGDLLLMNPGIRHQGIYRKDNQYKEFILGFTQVHFRNMKPNVIDFGEDKRIYSIKDKYLTKMEQVCFSIEEESKGSNPGRYFMIKTYLMQLILLLYRNETGDCDKESSKNQGGRTDFDDVHKNYVVDQMIAYLNEHYMEKISLDQIAKNMYLSTFYISKIFKAETGNTPINYLIEKRMEKAKELLESNEKVPIQTIASAVGYDDVYHFSKSFKKSFGTPPSTYRKLRNSR